MTREQYQDYLGKSSALARPRIAALMATSAWRGMSGEAQARAVERIIQSARDKAREKMKRTAGRRDSHSPSQAALPS